MKTFGLLLLVICISCSQNSSTENEDNDGNGSTEEIEILAPFFLQINSSSSQSITLSWQNNSENEDGYLLERKINDDDFEPLISLPANSTQYTDSNLEGSSTYEYRVMAFKGNSYSEASNIIKVASIINDLLMITEVSTPRIYELVIHPINNTIITAEENYLCIRNISDGSILNQVQATPFPNYTIDGLDISQNGEKIMTGSGIALKVFNSQNLQEIFTKPITDYGETILVTCL